MYREFRFNLECPTCHKGSVLADGRAKVTISVVCPKCGHCYTADLDALKTERATAQKRLGKHRK